MQCELLILNKGVQSTARAWELLAMLRRLNNLPSSSEGSGQIVAIVVPYLTIQRSVKDLAVYRRHDGLPTAKDFLSTINPDSSVTILKATPTGHRD